MKKKIFFIAILACVLLSFTLTSCEEPPQLIVIITDIPTKTDYKYGYIGFGNKDGFKALSLPVPISNGKFTAEMITEDGDPFTENGTYQVILLITSDSKGQNEVYSGARLAQKIQDESTTISFNSFTETTTTK